MARFLLFIYLLYLFYSISAIHTSIVAADYQGPNPSTAFLSSLPELTLSHTMEFHSKFLYLRWIQKDNRPQTPMGISLSIQSGTITPSTFGPAHEGLYAPMVTITGTDLAIITVSDSQGHIGKSIAINIVFPITSSPTPTPSVPEFPLWTIPLLLTIMLASPGLLVYHKKNN